MMWKEKEKLEPKEIDISGMLAQLYELHPDKKYVLWFKEPLYPEHIAAIRRNLQDVQGIKMSVIMGVNPPEIFEDKDNG